MPLTFSENKTQSQIVFSKNKNAEQSDLDLFSRNPDFHFASNKYHPEPDIEKENVFNFEDKKNSRKNFTLENGHDIKSECKHVYISEDIEEDSVVETTALRQASEPSNSTLNNSFPTNDCLTVSGTIKRGKKKGQNVEVVLNMSREELEILEANITKKKSCVCNTKLEFGGHIFLWSVFCMPFSFFISAIYSFCIGTITWYNVFTMYSEKKPLGYKLLFPPLLIILYPFLIVSLSLGLGFYAGITQLTCCWNSWLKEFTDYEKGFYGWLCNSLDIPECSPYEVVILSNIRKS